MRNLLGLLLLITVTTCLPAQDAERNRILEKYRAIRPTMDELAMYRLDWEASLSDAQKRATAEGRPIMLIIIHARYGDITSGHC